jgi:hypothetical protein
MNENVKNLRTLIRYHIIVHNFYFRQNSCVLSTHFYRNHFTGLSLQACNILSTTCPAYDKNLTRKQTKFSNFYFSLYHHFL